MVAKLRIRFCKTGDLRFLSHHDLMRLFERMLRRAELPFVSTEGFHPKPKMVFASALGLGVIGRQEVLEIEMADGCPAEEVHRALSRQSLPGLEILSIRTIDRKAKAQVRQATYFVPFDPMAVPDLGSRVAQFLAAHEYWVTRTRPQTRRFDLRPYVANINVMDRGLLLTLRVTPNGAARPEEIVTALGLTDILEGGAIIERTALELIDESSPETTAAPPCVTPAEGGEPAPALAGCYPPAASPRAPEEMPPKGPA